MQITSRLLRADFFALFRTPTLYVLIGGAFFFGVYFVASMNEDAGSSSLQAAFLMFIPLATAASSVLCSIFDGNEYAAGLLRSKLVNGHRRASAYLSLYLVNLCGSYLIAAAYLIALCPVYPRFADAFTSPEFIPHCILGAAAIAASVALFHAVAMGIGKQTVGVAVCGALAFALLAIAFNITVDLAQPPTLTWYEALEQEGVGTKMVVANDEYIAYPLRAVYEFVQRTIPYGQAGIILAGQPWSLGYILYSGLLWVVSCVAGLVVFERKNVK